MRELDKLTLISLAEHEPERAVVWGEEALMHAVCAEDYLRRAQAMLDKMGNKYRIRLSLPEGTDLVLWTNDCRVCARVVDTQNLKPI